MTKDELIARLRHLRNYQDKEVALFKAGDALCHYLSTLDCEFAVEEEYWEIRKSYLESIQ